MLRRPGRNGTIQTLRSPHHSCVAIALVLLGIPRAAAADPELSPAARKRFDQGLDSFKHGDYAGASAAFEAVYALDTSLPAVLYAWAQAERLGGRCPHATELYTKYRAAKITPSQDEAARDGIAQCDHASPPPPAPTPPPEPQAQPHPPASSWAVHFQAPADELVLGGVIALGVAAVLFSHGNDDATEAQAAPTLDAFHAGYDSARDVRIGGALAIIASGALIGTGIYLRVHHHEVQTTTDGRVVMIGARF